MFSILVVVFCVSERSVRSVGLRTVSFPGEQFENYDIRLDESPTAVDAIRKMTEGKKLLNQVLPRLDSIHTRRSDLNISIDPRFPAVELVMPSLEGDDRFLTSPTLGSRADALLDYISKEREIFRINHSDASRLLKTSDYTNPNGDLSFVHFEQHLNGIPVFQAELKAGFSRRNEIISVVNGIVPGLDERDLSHAFGSENEVAEKAYEYVGQTAGNGRSNSSQQVYFPIDAGLARPAWRFQISAGSGEYFVVVDAEMGTLLWRKSLTEFQTQSATYNVYGNQQSLLRTADSPTPGTPGCASPTCAEPSMVARQTFTLIGNEGPYSFNNLGWIPDGENRTIGNNVEAGIDRDSTQGIDPNGWAFGDPARIFVYEYNPSPGTPPPGESPTPTPPQPYPPTAFQQGSITNAFYTVNRWHDETYRLGFNEQARNYQTDNFGRGGVGGDSIVVEVQEGIGTNGANFSTPADGGRPRLQLFVWTGTSPARDGALDNQVIVHEVTHGLSGRLIGNATGLASNMARSMGEGWSDFFAVAMLSEPTDDNCGVYPVGNYSVRGIVGSPDSTAYHGLRRFPISRRGCTGPNGLPHNPLTFAYVNATCNTLIGTSTSSPPPNSAYPRGPLGSTTCDQTWNAGEVWASAMWEMRGQLIDRHGASEGNRRALQYTVDGMKLSPLNPTMLQARDAIVVAAQASNPQDFCPVFRGFAIRGFGQTASIQNAGSGSNNTVVTESFQVPASCQTKARADFDGDGRSDVSVFRPSDGVWYLNRSSQGFAAIKWGLATDVLSPGDFDGDGKTDVAVFRGNDSGAPDFYVFNSSNSTITYFYWGAVGDVPVVEDFDGDSRADAAIYRPATGVFWILQSSNGAVLNPSGFPAGEAVVGDFDGDRRADMGTIASGQWSIARSASNYASVSQDNWGLGTDIPVPADYDGDGIVDPAVFRPSEGVWYVRRSTGGVEITSWGLNGDVPVPGDYDGDGRSDQAVYRNGMWFVNRSTGGTSAQPFGLAADRPVPSAYVPQN